MMTINPGISIFETMKINSDGIEVPHLHWVRMKKGGDSLGISVPEYAVWLSNIHVYLNDVKPRSDMPLSPFALRAEIKSSSAWSFSSRDISYNANDYLQGINVVIINELRRDSSPLTYIKSPDFLDSVGALKKIQADGFFEGLWFNSSGQLVEGTRSNVFIVKNGEIFTPSLASGCLAGTRREIVKEMARELDLPFSEEGLSLPDLYQAQEVFLTNSLMGIMPVSQIGDTFFEIFETESSITKRLSTYYPVKIKDKINMD